jgi:hypothetical protein
MVPRSASARLRSSCAVGIVEAGAGALDIRLGQTHGRLGLGHGGLGLQAGAGVEERGIGGLDDGDDTSRPRSPGRPPAPASGWSCR